jgi:hypothetical protein
MAPRRWQLALVGRRRRRLFLAVEGSPRRRELPQVLIGLLAVAVALAVAVPLTASIVMNGIRDVKRTRDTIVVTGSAKQPIEANLAEWYVTVGSHERTPAAAARSLRTKAVAVRKFLVAAGLSGDVTEPPVEVERTSDEVPTGLKKPRFRSVPAYDVTQQFNIQTKKLDTLVRAASQVDQLLIGGVDVSVGQIQYLSTNLRNAKFAALRLATADAHDRAATIAEGLGGHLGGVRSVNLGVYQITPRNSSEVSGEGILDTSTREKDVTAVVSVTFAVDRG